MKIGFTPKQVVRLTGVPYSTLNLWANKGLVSPSVSEGTGSGSERVYSFADLVALKVAFALRQAGVTTRSLQKVVEFLRNSEGMDHPLAETRLVINGRDVVAVKGDRDLVSVLSKPGQGCLSFVIDLPRTLGELSEIARKTDAYAMGYPGKEVALNENRKRSGSTVKSAQQRERRA